MYLTSQENLLASKIVALALAGRHDQAVATLGAWTRSADEPTTAQDQADQEYLAGVQSALATLLSAIDADM